MPNPWDELGITPTSDEGAIRRAYAAGLKGGRGPNDDPAGFARLRAAYEDAMRLARQPPGDMDDAPADVGPGDAVFRSDALDYGSASPAQPAPDAIPPVPSPVAAANAFLTHLQDLMHAGDGPAAAGALQDWLRGEADRPLDVAERVEEALFHILAEPGTPHEALAALGDAYGHDFEDIYFARRHPALLDDLPARVAAAQWWRGVQRIAAAGPPGAGGGHPSRIAAAMLGPPDALPPLAHWTWRGHPVLRDLLHSAMPHIRHLEGRLDHRTLGHLHAAQHGVRWFGAFFPVSAPLLRAVMATVALAVVLLLGLAGAEMALEGRTTRFPPPDRMVGAIEANLRGGVVLRQFGPDTLIYFTSLLTCRGAVSRIRYGVDTPVPDRDFALPPLDPAAPVCGPTPRDVPVYATVPGTVVFGSVQVTWADGVTSPVEPVHHGGIRMPR